MMKIWYKLAQAFYTTRFHLRGIHVRFTPLAAPNMEDGQGILFAVEHFGKTVFMFLVHQYQGTYMTPVRTLRIQLFGKHFKGAR